MKLTPRQKQIQDEHGAPFWELVKRYADMDYSLYATAKALGYSGPSLLIACSKYHDGVETADGWFISGGKSKAMREYSQSRKGQPGCRKPFVLFGVLDDVFGHAERFGRSPKTIRCWRCAKRKDPNYETHPNRAHLWHGKKPER